MTSALSPKKTFRDSAIVLRTQDLAETDRIVILCTRDHGIVHAVARGVRRSSSKLGGRLEPFMLVDISAALGKKLATISQAVTQRAYSAAIVSDYASYTVASVICELAEQLLQDDREASTHQFMLLAGALSALARRTHSPYRVLDSYIVRAFSLGGWRMATDSCGICGAQGDFTYFSPEVGLLCSTCGRKNLVSRVSPVPAELPPYLAALASGNWSIIDAPLPPSLFERTSRLMMDYAQWHLERPLKTLSILEKEF